MEYVADTVVLVRHFSSGLLGKGASAVLQDADRGKQTIWVSVVSLAEILYHNPKVVTVLDEFPCFFEIDGDPSRFGEVQGAR
jgi:predicted nucleic acid-binding protein